MCSLTSLFMKFLGDCSLIIFGLRFALNISLAALFHSVLDFCIGRAFLGEIFGSFIKLLLAIGD